MKEISQVYNLLVDLYNFMRHNFFFERKKINKLTIKKSYKANEGKTRNSNSIYCSAHAMYGL